jgi:hypothetical protein
MMAESPAKAKVNGAPICRQKLPLLAGTALANAVHNPAAVQIGAARKRTWQKM